MQCNTYLYFQQDLQVYFGKTVYQNANKRIICHNSDLISKMKIEGLEYGEYLQHF